MGGASSAACAATFRIVLGLGIFDLGERAPSPFEYVLKRIDRFFSLNYGNLSNHETEKVSESHNSDNRDAQSYGIRPFIVKKYRSTKRAHMSKTSKLIRKLSTVSERGIGES